MKDRVFWYVVVIFIATAIINYIFEPLIVRQTLADRDWHLVFVLFRGMLFMALVGITADRFGMRAGLAACVLVGLVLAPHLALEMQSAHGSAALLAQAAVLASMGFGLSWLASVHRQTRLRLARQSGFLESVFGSVPEAIAIIHATDFTLVKTNRAFALLYGLTRESAQGVKCYELIEACCGPCPSPHRPCRVKDLLSTGQTPSFEYAMAGVDGETIYLEGSASGIQNHRDEIRYLALVMRDITERKKTEEKERTHYRHQEILNTLLQLSLESLPLTEVLQRALDTVVSIPWLSREHKGSLFLVEEGSQMLVMASQRGMPATLLEACARVPFGRCLCGRAASLGNIQHSSSIDEKHETRYDGMLQHGHYCVPICSAAGKTLGVMNLYLHENHQRGEGEAAFLGMVASILAAIIERAQADETIRRSLREKEILLREVHHRVKNNLQVVTSLLNLQSSRVADKATLHAFDEARDRVMSMALVHQQLGRASSDPATIDFASYSRDLSQHLMRSCVANPDSVDLELDVDSISLPIDLAIPCGLIVNELVTNALKHGLPDGRKGRIRISLKPEEDDALNLVVSDDGRGIPSDLDFANANSLGMQLVTGLVRQIGGSIHLVRAAGTEWRIRFNQPRKGHQKDGAN